MDISIIGATGGCGREMVNQLIRDRILERTEVLQLVSSNPNTNRPHLLHGLRADLQDAYAEIIPQIDVTSDPDDIIGDVIIMTAGVTFSTDMADMDSAGVNRDMLARNNTEIFEKFAKAVYENRKDNPPVVIIVTNPVELGVEIFCRYLPRENVIGMGAYSDSLRFRWEIASELGIKRQRVQGYMLGEHGSWMVPLWSSVRVQGFSPVEWKIAKERLMEKCDLERFHEKLAEEQSKIIEILSADHIDGPGKALQHVRTCSADLRVGLKPFVVHFSEAKTLQATATATTELVKAVFEGKAIEIAVQYKLEGEEGLHIPFGSRVILAGKVERVVPSDDISEAEMKLIQKSGAVIARKLKEWTGV